ncbi:MAG: hypothetical protein US86_C0004G0044 [Candidatus Daviesbacteria bacterium GW2011_GWA2_38_24]|uniref:Uncharacterized protein n=1 Tax=Candidatus Daviesbacteria bacterium GW2011_GWA2_38_24 TaxID=1618422 RepID=A0A0G0MPA7_9BACT|nr:MAG: hypothetical protein US86_C0004G0044 [Candidatus Daviesbacteria bacterium GW2011_GWA2_38_24]OGE23061.1 MAG: hypothetical protein A2688_03655 [Candidatus Daviesbacteria bacterium RIFCSPHIGHO2_01_FULL_38_8]
MQKKLHFIVPLALSIVASIIYLYTAPKAMLWLDSGRLLAGIVTLGIPNPPEPLYMLFGHLFSFLPLGDYIFRLQILSAVFAASTLFLIYLLINRIINYTSKNSPKEKYGQLKIILSSCFGTLVLGFSYQFWSQAQNIENFILVSLLSTIILSLALFLPSNREWLFKKLLIIAFLFGIGSGTNPVLSSIFPSILLIMALHLRLLSIKKLITLFFAGIAGIILVYLYIPIRASQQPFLNWWNPVTFENLWNLSTGSGINVYNPELGRINGFTGSIEVFMQSTGNFFRMWVSKFTMFILPFMLLGLFYLWRKSKYLFFILFIVVLTNIILTGLYLSGNQESWFLVSDTIWAILAGVGFFYAASFLLKVRDGIYLVILISLLSLSPLVRWWPSLNRQPMQITDDYVQNLYSNAEEPAIVLGSSDIFDAVSYYKHEVKKFKRGVLPVVDNLIYIDEWYSENLRNTTDLKIPDTTNLKRDSAEEYSKFLNDFFALNMDKYKIYTTTVALRAKLFPAPGLNGSLEIDEDRFKVVPQGLLLEIIPKESSNEPKLANFDYKFQTPEFPKRKPKFLEKIYNEELAGMVNEYAYSFMNLGDFYLEKGEKDKAQEYYKKALDYNSANSEILGRISDVDSGKIEPGASASAKLKVPFGFNAYESKSFKFNYPKEWFVDDSRGVVKVSDPSNSFKVEISTTAYDGKDNPESFAKNQKSEFGTLKNQGLAKVPFTDYSYVKVWEDSLVGNRLQFYLFKGDKVVEMVVYPTTSPLMKQFDGILGSIRLK